MSNVDRKRFLGLSAAAAGALGAKQLFGVGGVDAAIMKPGQFDQTFLTKKADIKQVWDFTSTDQAQTGIGAMKNAMNAFQFSYLKSHYLLIVLRGPSAVVYGMNDAMWAKYGLGAKYQIFDQARGAYATHNPLYPRTTSGNGKLDPNDQKSLFEDASLQALQQRGAFVVVCHDALEGQARLAVRDKRAHGMTMARVYADMAAHLIPGAEATPSGSSVIAIAQMDGFTYAKQ
ncbi:MAG TPA: hypothetical protein VIJ28_13040 [Chloroflexota bacterium]|jgi:intracellular sulfur oxidation DsrE/DsrF family protein